MTLDITQFYQTFFDEADELLAQMEGLLLSLDVARPDDEDLAAIFRAAHSIKGGAATFGFAALTDTTHTLESLLDRARNHEIKLTLAMVDAFLETKDVLSEQLTAYRASAEPDAGAAAMVCAKLAALSAGATGVEAPGAEAAAGGAGAVARTQGDAGVHPNAPSSPAGAIEPAVPDHVLEQAEDALHGGAPSGACRRITLTTGNERDRALLLEELGNLGHIVKQQADAMALVLWLDSDVSTDDLVAVCCFVIDEDQIAIEAVAQPSIDPATAGSLPNEIAPALVAAATQAAPQEATPALAQTDVAHTESATPATDRKPRAAAPAVAETSSIRVGVEKVDHLINLVGELVITQAMLAQTASDLDVTQHERLLNGMSQLERNARDLQAAVMSIRMLPMDYVFSRFPRLVRDLAAKLGKQVELVTFGQATELDKGLIERIVDPLTHLVRNSLDHGIETMEARRAAGKDPVGQLMLSAAHAGGNIVIEVSDDGAGLNRERILAKAASQGLPVSDTMRDEEVWNLIFASGFSTAATITDVSGRGVGMDVVKRNINEMGGHVEISSQAGRGTTTRIIVPLTLAILDGMSVRVGEEIFILPLNCVMESLQPRTEEIYTVGNGVRLVRVRGEYLPLVALHEVFSVGDARHDPTTGIVTILQAEGRRFALLVDELMGQQQVVVKNLETHYRKVPGIAAATILGDGRVALIVDVAALDRTHAARSIDTETFAPA